MLRFGLIGYPISHSLSPRLFEAAYGGRFKYDLIEEEDFEKAWEAFTDGPYRAVNVTAPFKEKALERILELNPEHEAVQAMQRAMTEDAMLAKDYAKLLCYQAQLMAQLPLDDPFAYSELVCRYMN